MPIACFFLHLTRDYRMLTTFVSQCSREGQEMSMKFNKTCVTLCTIVALTLLQLAGCSDKDKKQTGPPPPLVSVYQIEKKDYPYPSVYQAQTQGSRAVEVRSRVSGIIEKRLYEEGAYVKEGQVLFQLERDQYEALVQEAAAQLDRTKREWDRIRPLYDKNAVSQKDRDNAKAAYDSAKAALRTAKINLDYCRVVSPVSGFSGKQQYTPGNLVNNNSPLTTVNQTEPLFVNFAIAGPAMMRTQQLMAEGRLKVPAQRRYTTKIRLLDGAMYEREGVVTFVDTQVDPLTGVVKARAEFPNPDGRVLPGQFVRLYMDGAMLQNAVLIPQKTVLMTQMGNLVMVVKADNTVEPRPITVSDSVGDMYLVEKGLEGNERIILEGLLKARPGQPVRIEDPQAAAGKSAAQPAGK